MTARVTEKLANGELRVTVSGEFGFETARELLFVCRARWQAGAKSIVVDMSGVIGLSSCGVGTLVLISELAGDGRFKLHLDNCSEDVRQLFSSGILDKYFKKGVVSCEGGSA